MPGAAARALAAPSPACPASPGSSRRGLCSTTRLPSPRAAPCSSAAPPCGTALRLPCNQTSAAFASPASAPTARGWHCRSPRRRADRARCTDGRRCCGAGPR
eukprot:scaffold11192_cov77-Phaeocystis_antarctica.AAC.3